MKKQTQTILIIGAAAIGVLWWLGRRQTGQAVLGPDSPSDSVAIAQAQAAAAIAQAKAASDIADAQKQDWYAPLLGGIGASLPVFAGSIGGMFGQT